VGVRFYQRMCNSVHSSLTMPVFPNILNLVHTWTYAQTGVFIGSWKEIADTEMKKCYWVVQSNPSF
jgi:hypothetical protein